MKRRALALAAAAAVALGAPSAHAADVRVTTSISPHPALFGDIVHATLTVQGDATATVQEGFAPFQVLKASSTSSHSGNAVVTRWRFDLQCLDARCAPGPGARTVALTASRVHVGSRTVVARFPAVQVEPRVTAAQVASPDRSFLRPITPPPPGFRFSPVTVQRGLVAAAAVLVLVALALAAPVLRPRRARTPGTVDPLARALALVRASRSRPPPDRRRALGLLARTLRKRGAIATGQTAADLAWSEPEPDPARMGDLVEAIEKTP